MRNPTVVLSTFVVLVFGARMAGAEWKAGVASVVITPDRPIWMAGYAARTEPSRGKLHNLHAKALALEGTDGVRVVIVTTDLIAITRSIGDAVSDVVEQRYGLSRASLLLNASHTHCGPELRPERVGLWELPEEQGAKIGAYVRRLKGKLVDVVGAALADLRPARLTIGQSAAGFAGNRRSPSSGGIVNRHNSEGPTDHDVPVLAVSDIDGKLRAVLFGYACHNTTLGIQQFNGDYAGFAQLSVERRHPGVTALFLMGAGGDQNPYPRRTVELCRRHGQVLANAVERSLLGMRTEVDGPLRTAYEETELYFQPLPDRKTLEAQAHSSNKYVARKARFLRSRLAADGLIDLTYPCPVQVVRLGREVLLIAIGGELVVDYSRRLKTDHAGPVTWVAGYSNDVFGYLPSRRVLDEGGYEGGGAMVYTPLPGPFDATVEDRVLSAVGRLVEKTNDR